MQSRVISSWGGVLREAHLLVDLSNRNDPLPEVPEAVKGLLPYGNGRSYGDSCLNPGGALLKTARLDHLIRFDPESGVLCCEAGTQLSKILRLTIPRGWFLQVVPGTRFITVGGAIANDVHGKNHHLSGTFGCHVRKLELLRSDGARLVCSREENPEFFAATIGGLGLTGLVTWAELQLKPIQSPWMAVETMRFGSLEDFFSISKDSDKEWEYTVAWIDCLARGSALGRGLFFRGRHLTDPPHDRAYRSRAIAVPFSPPFSLVNTLSLKAFNEVYYHRQTTRKKRFIQHHEPFFFPLDGILEWNRIYGAKGFYQYQCVLPTVSGEPAVRELLKRIGKSGMGSFLAVLKYFGDVKSPGMLSFPMPGVTLALDFPNNGGRLHLLFQELDSVVSEAGGRLYPAKDGRMPGWLFRRGYPEWRRFSRWIDPRFSSGFWRRVMEVK